MMPKAQKVVVLSTECIFPLNACINVWNIIQTSTNVNLDPCNSLLCEFSASFPLCLYNSFAVEQPYQFFTVKHKSDHPNHFCILPMAFLVLGIIKCLKPQSPVLIRYAPSPSMTLQSQLPWNVSFFIYLLCGPFCWVYQVLLPLQTFNTIIHSKILLVRTFSFISVLCSLFKVLFLHQSIFQLFYSPNILFMP